MNTEIAYHGLCALYYCSAKLKQRYIQTPSSLFLEVLSHLNFRLDFSAQTVCMHSTYFRSKGWVYCLILHAESVHVYIQNMIIAASRPMVRRMRRSMIVIQSHDLRSHTFDCMWKNCSFHLIPVDKVYSSVQWSLSPYQCQATRQCL